MKLVPAFRKPLVTLKYVPKADCDPNPAIDVLWRKWTNESEGKPERNSDAAFGTTLQLVRIFKVASSTFIFILFLNKAG